MPKITSVSYYDSEYDRGNGRSPKTSITMEFDDLSPEKLVEMMGGKKEDDYETKVSDMFEANKKKGAK